MRREYHSSNCHLTIEGINNNPDNNYSLDILLNAEFRLISSNKILSGGKIFLENIAKTVNAYVQSLLSGLPHHPTLNLESDVMEIKPHQQVHRLTWQKTKDEQQDTQTIDLTTVEVFDLVETIDQLLLDTYTLPEFSLTLQPLSRRHRQDGEPILDRTVPAFVGLSTVLVTAIAAFMVEPPVVKEPQPQPLEGTTETVPPTQNSPIPSTSP